MLERFSGKFPKQKNTRFFREFSQMIHMHATRLCKYFICWKFRFCFNEISGIFVSFIFTTKRDISGFD